MRLGALLATSLALVLACVPEIHEQCPLIEDGGPAPGLSADFASVDDLLVHRALCMTNEARALRGALARSFRLYFAYDTLPLLCGRLEQARRFAVDGQMREAGRKYQALLLASQVVELAIALHAFAEWADGAGVPSGRILEMQALFGDQMVPLLDAALSEDPGQIQRALAEHGAEYGAWIQAFERWTSRVNAQTPRLRVAKLIWDATMLIVATYEAAGADADWVAGGRPSIPPLPALAGSGGAVVASPAGYAELAEALRRLIASGALDVTVVVGLSHLGAADGSSPPQLPTSLQMSDSRSNSGRGAAPQRGIGGSGWRGDAQWKSAVRLVNQGGTIRSINGEVPTVEEARALISEAGGRAERFEPPHSPPNPHDFWHINYYTSNGVKGTLEVLALSP